MNESQRRGACSVIDHAIVFRTLSDSVPRGGRPLIIRAAKGISSGQAAFNIKGISSDLPVSAFKLAVMPLIPARHAGAMPHYILVVKAGC